MDQKKLIQACLNEEEAAQKHLYDIYSPKMYFVCLRYARHDLEAQDMLQDGFIKVFDKLSSFKSKGSFEGWIRRIVVNTSLNYCRKSSYKNEQIGIEDYQDKTVDPKAISALGEQELLKLIQQLPNGYRMVFNLYVIEGYSHKEIGELLDVTESTSRSQLAKAKKWMQIQLEKQKIRNHV